MPGDYVDGIALQAEALGEYSLERIVRSAVHWRCAYADAKRLAL
jgi:hypothetical protein